MNSVIIDVREKDEFSAEHVANSIHLPLSEFQRQAPGVLSQLRDREILILCRSGNRAKMAMQQIAGFGIDANCKVIEGGILEWKKQGKPTVALKKGHLPIIRQVQMTAGGISLASVIATFAVDPRFSAIAGAVGAGLFIAGATGTCLLAEILAKMPWNRTNPELKKELCEVSPGSEGCCG